MLAGLAHQHAGDYLSARDKLGEIGMNATTQPLDGIKNRVSPPTPTIGTRRVAIITDGYAVNAALNYVIDSCNRQNAQVDLLIHGLFDLHAIENIEKQIKKAHLCSQRIFLGINANQDVIDYICQQRALMFVVAIPTDKVAQTFIEEVIPSRGGRLPVPMVLIAEKEPTSAVKQNAA